MAGGEFDLLPAFDSLSEPSLKIQKLFPEAVLIPREVLQNELQGATPIGQGRAGVVWRVPYWRTSTVPGEDGKPVVLGAANSDVVVKLLKQAAQPAAERMLHREVKVALGISRLKLQHVLRLYGYTESHAPPPDQSADAVGQGQLPQGGGAAVQGPLAAAGPAYAVVMESCSGASLTDQLGNIVERKLDQSELEASFRLEKVALQLSQVVSDLKILSQHGWVLQDISAGNILLTGGGVWKLADFGFSWHANEAHVRCGEAGTWLFRSYQKLRAKTDPNGDLFSLMMAGLLVHTCLAGCPFDPLLLARRPSGRPNWSELDCRRELRQLVVAVTVIANHQTKACPARLQAHVQAPPLVWYLGSWIMLLGTLDWEVELSPEPAGWRLSHEQLVKLLDQWEEITTDMKARCGLDELLPKVKAMAIQLLGLSVQGSHFKDQQLERMVFEFCQLDDGVMQVTQMYKWREQVVGEHFTQRNLPEPGERYRLLQHHAHISKLRARVQASLTDFHDAREAYFLERMAKEKQEAAKKEAQKLNQPAGPAAAPSAPTAQGGGQPVHLPSLAAVNAKPATGAEAPKAAANSAAGAPAAAVESHAAATAVAAAQPALAVAAAPLHNTRDEEAGLTAYRVEGDGSGRAAGGMTPRLKGRGSLSGDENAAGNQLPASPGFSSLLAKTPGGGLPFPPGLYRFNMSRVTKAQFKEMLRLDNMPNKWDLLLRTLVDDVTAYQDQVMATLATSQQFAQQVARKYGLADPGVLTALGQQRKRAPILVRLQHLALQGDAVLQQYMPVVGSATNFILGVKGGLGQVMDSRLLSRLEGEALQSYRASLHVVLQAAHDRYMASLQQEGAAGAAQQAEAAARAVAAGPVGTGQAAGEVPLGAHGNGSRCAGISMAFRLAPHRMLGQSSSQRTRGCPSRSAPSDEQ